MVPIDLLTAHPDGIHYILHIFVTSFFPIAFHVQDEILKRKVGCSCIHITFGGGKIKALKILAVHIHHKWIGHNPADNSIRGNVRIQGKYLVGIIDHKKKPDRQCAKVYHPYRCRCCVCSSQETECSHLRVAWVEYEKYIYRYTMQQTHNARRRNARRKVLIEMRTLCTSIV